MIEKNKNLKNNSKGGFTLIEVVLILVLAGGVFVALYGIFGKTIIFDKESGYEVIASNLAQEGVEIVRNIRDQNVIENNGVFPATTAINKDLSAGTCYPFWDETSGNLECENSGTSSYNEDIELEDLGGGISRYQNCSGGCSVNTPYERECYIENLDNGDVSNGTGAFAVSCVVEWTGLSGITRQARAMAIFDKLV